MRRIQVEPPESKSYAVDIAAGLLRAVPGALARLKRTRWAVICDDNVMPLYGLPLVEAMREAGLVCDLLSFHAGEGHKTLATAGRLALRMLEKGFGRDAGVLALGGGLTGDLAGFTAGIYMRGIPFVLAPTSLLAMIDASVGGKTGVNLGAVKNILGLFNQPQHVFIDTDLLSSLPPKEFQSGLGEMAKYAMLDAGFHAWVLDHGAGVLARDSAVLEEAVDRCVHLKAAIVARDEKDTGERMLLNYGHTFGHAIETSLGFLKPHGWCVALGMRMAADLALRLGLCDQHTVQAQNRVLASLALGDGHASLAEEGLTANAVIRHMRLDKKRHAGEHTCILPSAVGRLHVVPDVDEAALLQTIEEVLDGA